MVWLCILQILVPNGGLKVATLPDILVRAGGLYMVQLAMGNSTHGAWYVWLLSSLSSGLSSLIHILGLLLPKHTKKVDCFFDPKVLLCSILSPSKTCSEYPKICWIFTSENPQNAPSKSSRCVVQMAFINYQKFVESSSEKKIPKRLTKIQPVLTFLHQKMVSLSRSS